MHFACLLSLLLNADLLFIYQQPVIKPEIVLKLSLSATTVNKVAICPETVPRLVLKRSVTSVAKLATFLAIVLNTPTVALLVTLVARLAICLVIALKVTVVAAVVLALPNLVTTVAKLVISAVNVPLVVTVAMVVVKSVTTAVTLATSPETVINLLKPRLVTSVNNLATLLETVPLKSK